MDNVVIFGPRGRIGSPLGGNFLDALNRSSVTIKSLILHENFDLNDSTLDVAGDIVCYKKLTVKDSTLRHAALRVMPSGQLSMGDGASMTLDGVSLTGACDTLDGDVGYLETTLSF